ncbi:unnamed protein product [Boreogadus saida]
MKVSASSEPCSQPDQALNSGSHIASASCPREVRLSGSSQGEHLVLIRLIKQEAWTPAADGEESSPNNATPSLRDAHHRDTASFQNPSTVNTRRSALGYGLYPLLPPQDQQVTHVETQAGPDQDPLGPLGPLDPLDPWDQPQTRTPWAPWTPWPLGPGSPGPPGPPGPLDPQDTLDPWDQDPLDPQDPWDQDTLDPQEPWDPRTPRTP